LVPTLEELIETVLDLDVGLQLELKPTAGDDIETAEIALDVLRSLWPTGRRKLFLSSFSVRSIKTAARLLPEVPRAFAVVVPPRDPRALLAETDCQILHCLRDLLTDDALSILGESGVEYAVAVVNDRATAEQLLASGAQTILTDIPDLLVAQMEPVA
jgi:glycerophosphoryl diester phosphodiesterase